MKAADTSTSFFPAEHGPSTSRGDVVGYGTSFVPHMSERKPANKLVKKRPSKTRSTPPSLAGQSGGGKEDTLIEAVVSNLDMIISKRYGSRKEQHQNASGELSDPDSLKGTYINLPSGQKGQGSGEYSSNSLGLKRAWSARDLHARQDIDDPFGRGPPVIIGRHEPGKAGNGSGSTISIHTHGAHLASTPEDARGKTIARYRPPSPSEEISPSTSIIDRNDSTKLASGAVPAERDDTVIAWYKPPPPQNINSPKPRADPQVEPYTTPAHIAPAASAESLARAFPQSSPDIASDVPPGLHIEPHLRTRPHDMAHPDAQYTPNRPRSISCPRPLRSALKRPVAPPLEMPDPSVSDLIGIGCESAAPKTPLGYQNTPFGPVPIYDPPEDIPARRRNRSKPIIGPSQPIEGLEQASPFIHIPHSAPLDRSERRGNAQAKSNDACQIGRTFPAHPSEGCTPLSASFGGFGGKASDIRNRILNERGGRA